MKINLDRYNKIELMRIICTMDGSCRGTITSTRSKYCGQTFKVVWSYGLWGIALKVMPINRTYTYTSKHVEITQKSINNFKKKITNTVDGALDFFNRPLEANDVIFYDGELYRIAWFIKENVAIQLIRNSEDWEDSIYFHHISRLSDTILIDDPLLLLQV